MVTTICLSLDQTAGKRRSGCVLWVSCLEGISQVVISAEIKLQETSGFRFLRFCACLFPALLHKADITGSWYNYDISCVSKFRLLVNTRLHLLITGTPAAG